MKTISIKGKPYVQVNERIKYFRANFKEYGITTEIISLEKGVCVMKANIINADNKIIATGHAYENENSTFINKTSFIENCETSAIGRALGAFGIGIDDSVASADEVQNAISNQKTKPEVRQESESFDSGVIKPDEEQLKELDLIIEHFKKVKDTKAVKQMEAYKNKSMNDVQRILDKWKDKKVDELSGQLNKVLGDDYEKDAIASGQQNDVTDRR